ncbi:ABC transporter permease [Pasteurellaceae bacterium LFhippo2]|nr:ABC transporter permease [Pasteurellaceae bacterium LFhippo2]
MNVQNVILWRKFFSGLAYTAMQSVFFVYLQQYKGFDTAKIACALSLLVFTSQAFSLFAGSWGDRFGRSRIMMLGALLDSIAYIILLLTDNYQWLYIATFLFGFGSTLFGTNARAFLLSHAGSEYATKTRAQGLFLRISSLASMVAPLLAFPFICFNKADWLIMLSCAIELSMFIFMLIATPKSQCANYKFERFSLTQITSVLSRRFVLAHLLLFIPLGLASSFYIIFPYIFTNLLDYSHLVPIAFFINNMIAVLLQPSFSKKVNLGVIKLSYVAPMLVISLFLTWIYVIENISLLTAFVYLVIFAIIGLFANTALANLLVRFDKGENQGVMFGMSKLVLSFTTALVMNAIPYMFLV